MKSRWMAVLGLGVGLTVSGFANSPAAPSAGATPAPANGFADEYISLETALPIHLSKQSETAVTLKFKVAPGFHVQSNPASSPQLIPTTLQMPAANNLEVSMPIYPKGKPYKLQGSNTQISTFDSTFEIKVPVKTAKVAGNFNWKGRLRYQACNEKTCFFPKTLPLELPVVIDK